MPFTGKTGMPAYCHFKTYLKGLCPSDAQILPMDRSFVSIYFNLVYTQYLKVETRVLFVNCRFQVKMAFEFAQTTLNRVFAIGTDPKYWTLEIIQSPPSPHFISLLIQYCQERKLFSLSFSDRS